MRFRNYKGEYEEQLTFYRPYGKFRITSPFGKRGNGFHFGCDYVGESGKEIQSIGAGVVSRTPYQESGGGNIVVIRSTWYPGLEVKYMHLSKVNVNTGDKVKAGDILGIEGSTGHSTGSHLHLEICPCWGKVDPEGKDVNWLNAKS